MEETLGRITARHRGGGKEEVQDNRFQRDKDGIPGKAAMNMIQIGLQICLFIMLMVKRDILAQTN